MLIQAAQDLQETLIQAALDHPVETQEAIIQQVQAVIPLPVPDVKMKQEMQETQEMLQQVQTEIIILEI
jgi:hypothetical protein